MDSQIYVLQIQNNRYGHWHQQPPPHLSWFGVRDLPHFPALQREREHLLSFTESYLYLLPGSVHNTDRNLVVLSGNSMWMSSSRVVEQDWNALPLWRTAVSAQDLFWQFNDTCLPILAYQVIFCVSSIAQVQVKGTTDSAAICFEVWPRHFEVTLIYSIRQDAQAARKKEERKYWGDLNLHGVESLQEMWDSVYSSWCSPVKAVVAVLCYQCMFRNIYLASRQSSDCTKPHYGKSR